MSTTSPVAAAGDTPRVAPGGDASPQQLVEAFLANLGDLEVAMPYLAEDVVYENHGTYPLPTWRSRESSRRFLKTFFAPFSGFGVEVHHIAASGPVVLTERTDMFFIGEHRADFWVCGRFEVRDGLIVHWRDYFDNGNLMRGLARGAGRAVLGRVLQRRATEG